MRDWLSIGPPSSSFGSIRGNRWLLKRGNSIMLGAVFVWEIQCYFNLNEKRVVICRLFPVVFNLNRKGWRQPFISRGVNTMLTSNKLSLKNRLQCWTGSNVKQTTVVVASFPQEGFKKQTVFNDICMHILLTLQRSRLFKRHRVFTWILFHVTGILFGRDYRILPCKALELHCALMNALNWGRLLLKTNLLFYRWPRCLDLLNFMFLYPWLCLFYNQFEQRCPEPRNGSNRNRPKAVRILLRVVLDLSVFRVQRSSLRHKQAPIGAMEERCNKW